jgi:hypothetical protein
MAVVSPLSRADREALRLQFFREYRGDGGCSSVSVRREKTGETYLSVGVNGSGARIPSEYEGLRVAQYKAGVAVHAVQYTAV